jgi:hypothetical protein
MKKILFFIVVFLVVGGYMIKNSLDTELETKEEKITFAKEFFSWVKGVGSNTKDVVGYATQQDWLPDVNDSDDDSDDINNTDEDSGGDD